MLFYLLGFSFKIFNEIIAFLLIFYQYTFMLHQHHLPRGELVHVHKTSKFLLSLSPLLFPPYPYLLVHIPFTKGLPSSYYISVFCSLFLFWACHIRETMQCFSLSDLFYSILWSQVTSIFLKMTQVYHSLW